MLGGIECKASISESEVENGWATGKALFVLVFGVFATERELEAGLQQPGGAAVSEEAAITELVIVKAMRLSD